jgi:hypothetical protein
LEQEDAMNRLLISLVALVALFITATGCSVEGTGEGDDGDLGGVRAQLMGTIPSGTYAVAASVTISCSTPGGCSGQSSVSASTTTAMPTITFPDLNLGSYTLAVAGAPMDVLIPAYYAGDPAIMTAAMPYCVYTGPMMGMPRTGLVGCSYSGQSPNPVAVGAGTTNTVALNFTFHFSDGLENTLFTGGDVLVTLQANQETVCGESTDPCPANQLCATVDDDTPTDAELACYPVCVASDPTLSAPAIPMSPWPAAVPCLYPNECVWVAGIGGMGGANRGICRPLAP